MMKAQQELAAEREQVRRTLGNLESAEARSAEEVSDAGNWWYPRVVIPCPWVLEFRVERTWDVEDPLLVDGAGFEGREHEKDEAPQVEWAFFHGRFVGFLAGKWHTPLPHAGLMVVGGISILWLG